MEADLLLWIHGWASPVLDGVFGLSHELGTGRFCLALVTVAVVWSLVVRRPDEALLWLVLGVSAYCLQAGLKVAVGRPRPELWRGVVHHSSFAFPSGHALAAATLYPLVGRAVGLRFPTWSRAAILAGVALALYVGFGRLYLGVHWPSDVLAGWTIGGLQTYAAVTWLRRRRERAAQS